MNDNIDIQVSDTPTAEETELILRNLVDFNDSQAGPADARKLAVLARNGPEIIGGLIGITHWNWLNIYYLWVDKSIRHQGLGRRLVVAAEKEARTRGCEHVHLDTFSFQAVPFYERLGYTVFGRLDDYPIGHSRVYLQKRNLP